MILLSGALSLAALTWRPNTHFDYGFLHLAFRKVLLDKLSSKLGASFKGFKNQIYKDLKSLRKCLSPQKQRYLSRLLDWRNSILLAFGYDPLRCPECGTSMLVLEVYHKKTALFERYRKVMGYG